MMHTVFYILVIWYYSQYWLTANFNPIGQEFANLVVWGLLLTIMKNGVRL